MRLFNIIILLGVALLSGCATFTRPISVQDQPDPKLGYIFGKFTLSESVYGMAGGLVIENQAVKKSYKLEMVNGDNDLYAIAVIPGKYKITRYLFVSSGPTIEGSLPSNDPRLTSEFEVKPNGLLYLGDYLGLIIMSDHFKGVSSTYTFQLVSAKDNYFASLALMMQKNNNLKVLKPYSIFTDK